MSSYGWDGIPSISNFRMLVEQSGFAAVLFPMLMYGHGFHTTPPTDNNICAFLWRAETFYGHGKFYARASAINVVKDVHFPTLHQQSLLCDTQLAPSQPDLRWQSVHGQRHGSASSKALYHSGRFYVLSSPRPQTHQSTSAGVADQPDLARPHQHARMELRDRR